MSLTSTEPPASISFGGETYECVLPPPEIAAGVCRALFRFFGAGEITWFGLIHAWHAAAPEIKVPLGSPDEKFFGQWGGQQLLLAFIFESLVSLESLICGGLYRIARDFKDGAGPLFQGALMQARAVWRRCSPRVAILIACRATLSRAPITGQTRRRRLI